MRRICHHIGIGGVMDGGDLAVTIANKMGSSEVLEALYPLPLRRGKPEYLRSDNGPEFSSEPFTDWLTKAGIKPIRIYPGSPWENGYNECLGPLKLSHYCGFYEGGRIEAPHCRCHSL